VLVSVYGALDEGYTVTTVHRFLSDLTPLLDTLSKRGVILAGDLNISTQWLGPHRSRHRNALERFATMGLVDCLALGRPARPKLEGCPCEDMPCCHVRTQRHPRSPVPWQTDYMFVSESLVSRVQACSVIDGGTPNPWELSDHCPIVLDIAS
jgi:exonuclease III